VAVAMAHAVFDLVILGAPLQMLDQRLLSAAGRRDAGVA
jgi:hypothetical protein